MKRCFFPLTFATALLFMVGVTPSAADTITADYAALYPGDRFTIGSLSTGDIEAISRECIEITTESFVGSDNTPSEHDYSYSSYSGAGSVKLPGSLTGVLARGTLDATLPASLEVTELTLDNNQILFLPFKRVSLPSSSDQPGAAIANATPLQVVTPAAAVAEVPEPGSLLLLGSSLLLFARVVRSRVK